MSKGKPRTEKHRGIVEAVLGITLPSSVEIHHVDGNALNNEKTNLVVCQDHQYHMLLHARSRAYDACGNPNFRKCQICKQWDDPTNMYLVYHKKQQQTVARHRACINAYQNERWRIRRATAHGIK